MKPNMKIFDSMKILLTGFEPFGGRDINLSGELATEMGRRFPDDSLVAVVLPVSFKKTPEALRAAIRKYRPDKVLMLGFSAKRQKVNVERVAINIQDAAIPDNDGCQPGETPICRRGPSAIFSTLPVKPILAAIIDAGVDATVSNSAGTYVCNTTFYTALHYSSHTFKKPQAGFIHLPEMDFQDAVTAVEAVVKYLLK